jgi:hypothetical protein
MREAHEFIEIDLIVRFPSRHGSFVSATHRNDGPAGMDEELDADYELLDSMTWDDSLGAEEIGEIRSKGEETPSQEELHDEKECGEELQVLDQLVQDIKEFRPLEVSQTPYQLDAEVSLVSTSKDAKIEISWQMFKNWDQQCEQAEG